MTSRIGSSCTVLAHLSTLKLKAQWDSSKVILLGDNGQYPADWPIFRLSETALMHPFFFSKPLTTLKKYFQFSTLCPRALRPSMTDWGHRKHTFTHKNQTSKPDYRILSSRPKWAQLSSFHLVKPRLKLQVVPGVDIDDGRCDGVLQAHLEPEMVHYCLAEYKSANCERKHAKPDFRGFTKATAEVIMLPPEPPITSRPPDSDSRITGAMDDGGCSPTETIRLQIRLARG